MARKFTNSLILSISVPLVPITLLLILFNIGLKLVQKINYGKYGSARKCWLRVRSPLFLVGLIPSRCSLISQI